MKDELREYAKGAGATPPRVSEVLGWIDRQKFERARASLSDLEHVIDWMIHGDSPSRLLKMSVPDAIRLSRAWLNKKTKQATPEPDGASEAVLSFDDGSCIKRLKTKEAFQYEGSMMSHCLGGYSPGSSVEIYSLRDFKNHPHATLEVDRREGQIRQVKGKGNGEIHPRYIHRVLKFLEHVGVPVRDSEMKNLGYYLIHPEVLEFCRSRLGSKDKLVELNGKHYVV